MWTLSEVVGGSESGTLQMLSDQGEFESEVRDLENLITRASEAYYLGEAPIMTDEEFDRCVEKLRSVSPNSECLVRVGWGMKVYKDKVKLPAVIESSLSKIQSTSLDMSFKFAQGTWIGSPKIDGLSCILQYRDGSLILAVTRGDGEYGIDITPKMMYIGDIGVPLLLSEKRDAIIRGELYIDTYTFEENLADKYANPRNTVAGIINGKGFENLKYVRFAAHPQGEVLRLAFEDRVALGILPYRACKSLDDLEIVRECAHVDGYPIDGVVIQESKEFDEASLDRIFAVKFETETVLTEVLSVEWNEGRGGRMVPTIEYKPVRLYGTECSRCSGFNYEYIRKNQIGPGSRIKLTKANEIIPYIVEIVSEGRYVELNDGVNFRVEGAHMFKIEYSQYERSLEAFVGWHYNIDGFKRPKLLIEALCPKRGENTRLTFKGFIQSAIYAPRSTLIEWLNGAGINGKAEELARKLHSPIYQNDFFMQFGLDGIGFSEAAKMQPYLREYIFEDNVEEILKKAGIRSNVYNVLIKPEIKEMLREAYLAYHTPGMWTVKPQEVKFTATTKVCITGTLPSGRTKAQFGELLKKRGIELVDYVNKDISFLIVSDLSSTSSKVKTATKLKIGLLTEDMAVREFQLNE
jgi:DNA ligase (NAD+)